MNHIPQSPLREALSGREEYKFSEILSKKLSIFKVIEHLIIFTTMNYFNQESTRLKFRKVTLEDIPNWAEFFVNNDGLKYVGINSVESKEKVAERWIEGALRRYVNQEFGFLAVELKDSGDFIGLGGFLIWELNGRKEHEIAFSLIPKYWGNGYATEIAQDYGFKNIHTDRFISIIHVDNIASIRVAQKNGMQVLFNTEFHGMNVDVYGINKP